MHFDYKSVPHNTLIQSVEKQLLSLTRRLGRWFYISEEKGVMYMKILQDAMDKLPMVLPMRNSLAETIGEDGLS